MSAISSKVAPRPSSSVANVWRNLCAVARCTPACLNSDRSMRSICALWLFGFPISFQKKYLESAFPFGEGTQSRAAFKSGGTGRKTGCPLFSVRMKIRHCSPSRLIRSIASSDTSPMQSAVYRSVNRKKEGRGQFAVSSCSSKTGSEFLSTYATKLVDLRAPP
jgi:hypothetical protein